MRKIIMWVLITLFSLIILAGGAIAIALNFIFTPAKLTPLVERVVNENLDARVSIGSVGLTFFSTFPNFALTIDKGALMSKTKDSTLVTDTIVSFDKVDIVVNPIALLRDGKVVVHKIRLDRPQIYAAILPSGVANWEIYSSDSTSIDSTSKSDKSLNIKLSNIKINDGNLIFDDRQSGLYTQTDSIMMDLNGDLSAAMADMDLRLSFRKGLLWHNNELIFSKINLSTKASLSLDSTTKKLLIRQSGFNLNNIEFGVDGWISPDSIDMKLGLATPSLATVLEILPLKRNAAKLSSTGSVEFSGSIRGAYKNGNIPVVDASLNIANATAHYSGFKYGIDGLNIKASAHLDMTRKSDSYVNVDKFTLKGASTSVDFKGRASQLLTNPKLKFTTTSKLDFTELAATLPLHDSIETGGVFTITGEGEVSASQIREGNYATIQASANVDMQDVKFIIKNRLDSHFSGLNIALSNSKEGLLEVNGMVRDVEWKSRRINSSLSGVKITASGVKNTKDSSSYIRGEMSYKDFKGSIHGDSVMVSSDKSNLKFQVSRTARLTFSTDSLYLKAVDNKFYMVGAAVDVFVDKKNFKGSVAFDGLHLSTPLFPLKMSMPKTALSVNNQDITLSKAILRVGSSDVVLTGIVRDLISASRGTKPLTMRVDVSSTMLNLTEIVHTLNMSHNESDNTKTESEAEGEIKLFKVPQGVDFELNTDLKKVVFGRLNIADTHGKVTLKDGIARLNNLSINTLGAKLATTIVYDCKTDTIANVGIMLGSSSIDVHSVIELMPSLDTLMPMMNSFEGKIDFALAADTKFHRGFSIDTKEIRATASFAGENMVLLDGQTFAEISKMLMFKNKARNVVDSVSVQMAVKNGAVEIFPFIIQLDRYRAAVGGQHLLNNDFKYHISVLKSPIPFKFGINITGSLDDMKVGIGKTQYKFKNQPTSVKQINPSYIELGREIRHAIQNL